MQSFNIHVYSCVSHEMVASVCVLAGFLFSVGWKHAQGRLCVFLHKSMRHVKNENNHRVFTGRFDLFSAENPNSYFVLDLGTFCVGYEPEGAGVPRLVFGGQIYCTGR